MKKLLTSFFALTLSVVFVSCNNNANIGFKVEVQAFGSWDTSLGMASFATDSVWIISGNGITQIWSDAVQTVYCSGKETYEGLGRIDCRSNPNQKGDLFSWCAVFQLNLCPDGWRIPDSADFRNLDIALGGNGQYRYQETVNGHSLETQLNWYTGTWGGAFGGICWDDGSLRGQGSSGVYWSQSDSDKPSGGFRLVFDTDGVVIPQDWGDKVYGFGFSLRCIRDN